MMGGPATYNLSGTGSLSANTETIGASTSGTFNQTGGTNTANTLTIKAQPTGSGTYNLSDGTLNATSIVNYDQFHYSGGVLNESFTGQTFTNNAGATLTLSGAGTRTVNASVTNNAGGTVTVDGSTAGTTAVFNGTFTNSGTLKSDPATLEFSQDLVVNPGGSIQASSGDQYVLHQNFTIDPLNTLAGWTTSQADLTFTGPGSHSLSFGGADLTWKNLTVDNGAALTLDATGKFHAASEIIGNAAAGALTQSRGSNIITGGLTVGSAESALGIYDLRGGHLTAASTVVGDAATGIIDPDTNLLTQAGGSFTQSGGTNTINGTLTLGNQAGSQGAYNLSGTGNLSANAETIGDCRHWDLRPNRRNQYDQHLDHQSPADRQRHLRSFRRDLERDQHCQQRPIPVFRRQPQ